MGHVCGLAGCCDVPPLETSNKCDVYRMVLSFLLHGDPNIAHDPHIRSKENFAAI